MVRVEPGGECALVLFHPFLQLRGADRGCGTGLHAGSRRRVGCGLRLAPVGVHGGVTARVGGGCRAGRRRCGAPVRLGDLLDKGKEVRGVFFTQRFLMGEVRGDFVPAHEDACGFFFVGRFRHRIIDASVRGRHFVDHELDLDFRLIPRLVQTVRDVEQRARTVAVAA